MHLRIVSGLLALAAISGCSAPTAKLPPRYFPMAAVAEAPRVAGPVDGESAPYRQQHWLVPGAAGLLSATLYRPDGPGPFPLILLCPDGPADAAAARRLADPLKPAAHWFAEHGYAVLVTVPRALAEGDPARSIIAAADDLDAAYGYLRGQSFVDAGRIVLAGQGTGGFAALDLAARQPTGVIAVLNFNGTPTAGPSAADSAAAVDEAGQLDLLNAFAAPAAKPPAPIDPVSAGMLEQYGRTTHRPELWLYAANEEGAARRMLAVFNHAGSAPARLARVPALAGPPPAIIDQPMLWSDQVAGFLAGTKATRR